MECDLIFARCFLLREQNWTQVGWLKIPRSLDSAVPFDFNSSLCVFNCTFKHFVNHQLKFLLNNFNYSGVSVDKQLPKQQVINLLCDTLIRERISRIYCHISLVEELRCLVEPTCIKFNKKIIILPSPPVDRVFISNLCLNSPNHNNVSCVKCILNNLYNKIVHITPIFRTADDDNAVAAADDDDTNEQKTKDYDADYELGMDDYEDALICLA